MILNDEDNKKVYENLDKIIEWLKGTQKEIREEIKTNIDANDYTIKFCIDNEYCRIFVGTKGYYLIGSGKTMGNIKDDKYAIKYIIDLIAYWKNIKDKITRCVMKQNNILSFIREFEV